MEIIIHLLTKKINSDYKLAMDEYIKRLSPFCKTSIKSYKSLQKMSFKNGSKIYVVSPGDNSPTSIGFATLIQDMNLHGISCIEFVICDDINHLDTVNIPTNYQYDIFNISSFSMSNELTAVVLTEQIYRAYTILNNITYHK